jgi:hypothetical protein
MPVSYFTGMPEISVPLYQIKGNKLQLPISMNYYSAGLRPDLHPGWVGDGWTLSAGGAITRRQNSWPDEGNWPSLGPGGYYFNYNDLNNSSWNSSATLEKITPPAYPYAGIYGASEADVEPDEFDFNFLGISGKFFLDQTGTWRVQSDKALKVIFNSATDFIKPFIETVSDAGNVPLNTGFMSNAFGKFTIVDELGNQYIFGGNDDNSGIEYSAGLLPTANGYGDGFYATSWMLTQIISADGSETINLNYQRGPFTTAISRGYLSAGVTGGSAGGLFTPACSNAYGYSTPEEVGNIISPVYLTSITAPSLYQQINFNITPSTEISYQQEDYINVWTYEGFGSQISGSTIFPSAYLGTTKAIPYFTANTPSPIYQNRIIWMELNSMSIMSTQTNTQLKSVTFNYNNNAAQRLQLESLTLGDQASLPVQNYSFGYNATQLPAYLTTDRRVGIQQ